LGPSEAVAGDAEKLGRHADAEAELAKLTAYFGDAPAYQDATI